jgi:hypothetical protein
MHKNLKAFLEACPAGITGQLLGLNPTTLHDWRKKRRIEAHKGADGRWRFNVTPFMLPDGEGE